MKQTMRKEPAWCNFYQGGCKYDECPAYKSSRRKTREEIEWQLMRDIPVTDDIIRYWCTRYNCTVAPRYIIEDVEE